MLSRMFILMSLPHLDAVLCGSVRAVPAAEGAWRTRRRMSSRDILALAFTTDTMLCTPGGSSHRGDPESDSRVPMQVLLRRDAAALGQAWVYGYQVPARI